MTDEIQKHFCKAVDHPDAKIVCRSFSDSRTWFNLIWQDGSSLMVRYCPFCGVNALKLNGGEEIKNDS